MPQRNAELLKLTILSLVNDGNDAPLEIIVEEEKSAVHKKAEDVFHT